MLTFLNFFSEPLNENQRLGFAQAIGLGELEFAFSELALGYVLRAIKVKGTRLEPILGINKEKDWLEWSEKQNFPCVSLSHSSLASSLPPELLSGIWEALLPFPLRALGQDALLPTDELRHSDKAFEQGLRRFEGAMRQLESCLQKTEVALLFLNTEEQKPIYLFHFVRKKLLSVAFQKTWPELWERWEEKSLKPQDLQNLFGTSATLVEWDVAKSLNILGFVSVSHALENALNTPHKILHCGFESKPAIHFEL